MGYSMPNLEKYRYNDFSDEYFTNTAAILRSTENPDRPLIVEAQIFTRSKRPVIVAGIEVALRIIASTTGYFESDYAMHDKWVNKSAELEIKAVPDGTLIEYGGDPKQVLPVMKIRGAYSDFAAVETLVLGVLSHMTRVATNVYEVLVAAEETQVMFYPARFDIPEAQYYDGFAYSIAVDAYNAKYGTNIQKMVSTNEQAVSFNGQAVGTSPHSLIASMKGNNVEAMHRYAMALPTRVKRVALVDFHNDCLEDAIAVASYYYERYLEAKEAGNQEDMKRWTLFGVRLDTSGNHVDKGLLAAGYYNAPINRGVTKELVWHVRNGLNVYAHDQYFTTPTYEDAWQYFSNIKIIVTGGFNKEKIAEFIKNQVPVDMFGVGSSLLRNDNESNADFTMDVVRIQQDDGTWLDVAKEGRAACDNPMLSIVNFDAVF